MSATQFLSRLKALFRRGRVEDDLSEELQFHLRNEIEENIGAGMSPRDARYAALRSFGGVDQIKEQCRDVRRMRVIGELWRDLRFGIRMLARNPGFAMVAVLSLALGIGANSAIFSVLNATLLRQRPYPKDPDRVHMLLVMDMNADKKMYWGSPQSLSNYLYWREHNQVFEYLAARVEEKFNLIGGEKPVNISGEYVSANFFSLMGVQAMRGRTFLPEENQSRSANVVVLSHGLWKRHFGASPDLVGKTVILNSQAFTVVGILPSDFLLARSNTELWVPLPFDQSNLSSPLRLISRLKPGVSLEQARSDMNLISRHLKEHLEGKSLQDSTSDEASKYEWRSDGKHPQAAWKGGWIIDFFPLNYRVGDYWERALFLLQSAAIFVLLIGCANVANLLLARGAARQKEVATRVALGATRFQLIRQFFTEGLLLAAAGGTVGLLLAIWGCDVLSGLIPANTPGLFLYIQKGIALDGRVAAYTSISALLAATVFGLAPALRASDPNLAETLKGGDGTSTESFGLRRGRSLLVIVGIASSVVLLTGAGLMIKSFLGLKGPYADKDPEKVLSIELRLDKNKYNMLNPILSFWDDVLQKTANLPGIQYSGAQSGWSMVRVAIQGNSSVSADPHGADSFVVTQDYFRAIGIRLKRGRYFTRDDEKGSLPVVLINESFAQRFLANNDDPVGKVLRITEFVSPEEPLRQDESIKGLGFTIVGVLVDLTYRDTWSFRETKQRPALYFPHLQSREILSKTMKSMNLAIRTSAAPFSLVGGLRSAVAAVDKDQAMGNPTTLEQLDSDQLAPARSLAVLMEIFALIAVGLAAVGIYGVMAYFVYQRTREIGIRVALGAQRKDVLWLVIRQGLRLILVGLGLGLVAAYNLTQVLTGYIFGVSHTDLPTYVLVSVLLVGVALLACYIPARRTMKIDPMVALRCE